jgi:hypothetical protein
MMFCCEKIMFIRVKSRAISSNINKLVIDYNSKTLFFIIIEKIYGPPEHPLKLTFFAEN